MSHEKRSGGKHRLQLLTKCGLGPVHRSRDQASRRFLYFAWRVKVKVLQQTDSSVPRACKKYVITGLYSLKEIRGSKSIRYTHGAVARSPRSGILISHNVLYDRSLVGFLTRQRFA